ncbi:RmlC-like cupin domain-containing protein [Gaertneriomyces semiglobifer]|nr:RmlC-like cupin domain-containing protein [Gaertneriomyces semiglobifer]
MASPTTRSITFPELVQGLHGSLAEPLTSSNLPNVQRLMSSYAPNPEDYSQFKYHDASKPYTRILIDSGNGIFNLMLLVWTQGKASPIHDHSGAHCLMKVLEGELVETQYEWPSDTKSDHSDDSRVDSGNEEEPMHVKQEKLYHKSQVAYIHDKIGLHRVSNPSESATAVSLHLYTPPYQECKTFCERTGKARPSGRCVFYKDFSNQPLLPELKTGPASASGVCSPSVNNAPVTMSKISPDTPPGQYFENALATQRSIIIPSK